MSVLRSLILVFVASLGLHGQNQEMVKETCDKIGKLQEKQDVVGQSNIMMAQAQRYMEPLINTGIQGEDLIQWIIRFQYRFQRALIQGCPGFLLNTFPTTPMKMQGVVDLDSLFTHSEVDSLQEILKGIWKQNQLYLFVVTIDDYFPKQSIREFSDYYLIHWGNGQNVRRGGAIITICKNKGELRISTDSVSKESLTDEECAAVIAAMTSGFKERNFFQGFIDGLADLKKKI